MTVVFSISSYADAAAGHPIDSSVHFVKLWGRRTPFDGGEVFAADMGTVDPGGPSRAKITIVDRQ